MQCIDEMKNYKGISIDKTLYYKEYSKTEDLEGVTMTIKCEYCGNKRTYFAGEMIYKHNHYKFCSYDCRAKWRKENPQKARHNTIGKDLQKHVDLSITEE